MSGKTKVDLIIANLDVHGNFLSGDHLGLGSQHAHKLQTVSVGPFVDGRCREFGDGLDVRARFITGFRRTDFRCGQRRGWTPISEACFRRLVSLSRRRRKALGIDQPLRHKSITASLGQHLNVTEVERCRAGPIHVAFGVARAARFRAVNQGDLDTGVVRSGTRNILVELRNTLETKHM